MAEEEGFKSKKAFRLVLLGWSQSGKSSSGNTILSTGDFLSGRKTSGCMSFFAEVAGREVTVVDTPGWMDFSLEDTPEEIQKELISSGVPTPDVVLLLVPLDIEVTGGYVQSIIDHFGLLGRSEWSRTMVLFTFGSSLRNQTIERYIEGNGALQYISGLCGDKYQVFENVKNTDGKQVEDLLRMIEKMCSDNVSSKETLVEVTEVDCKTPQKTTGATQGSPELRMVLLGLPKSGKSSTGNTILGRFRFKEDTKRHEKEEAEEAGRRLVVVDAPPWQKSCGASPDQNIVHWVCQCPPGPHALLFVLNLCSRFREDDWTLVQRYMELLGERAWEHVIVVFTGADILEGSDMAAHIKTKGATLETLLEKCGNRHYIFNNKSAGRSTQVEDLLKGIEKMSSQHSVGFYRINKTVADCIEEENRALNKKAFKEETFRDKTATKLMEVRMVLLGEKGSGKSTVAKMMAKWFYKEQKKKCAATRTTIDGRRVLIVDTPGWPTETSRDDSESHETIRGALSLCDHEPHAILIVVNLRSNFTETHRVSLQHNLACLPDSMWQKAMVLFTFGESLQGGTIERYIKTEGDALEWLVGRCNNRYHVFSDTPFDDMPQVRKLLRKIDVMVEENKRPIPQRPKQIFPNEEKDSFDMEDDFEYTARERKMIKTIVKQTRKLLLMEINSLLAKHGKTAEKSLSFIHPDLSVEHATSDEGIGQQPQSSGIGSLSAVTTEDLTDANLPELPSSPPLIKIADWLVDTNFGNH